MSINKQRIENRFADLLLETIGNLPPRKAVEKLMQAGLIDLRACERRAIYHAVRRAERAGTPRCEAFETIAEEFCCSYEKARNAFYKELRAV